MSLFRILICVTALLLAGCLEDNTMETREMAAQTSFMGGNMAKVASIAPAPMPPGMPMDASAPLAAMKPSGMVLDRSRLNGRRVAETHNLSIETTYNTLQGRYQRDYAECLKLECEISNSSLQREQSGYIQARIMPDKLGAFLDFLAEGEGRILNHQISADDQTMEYSDVSAQLDNLNAMRERMRKLLDSEKAKDVDGILRIEQELTRIQTEIDMRTARLRILEKTTSMATVMLNYSVQYRPAEIEPYKLKNTWKMAVRKFMAGVDRMIQFVGAVLPWLPVIFIGFWLSVRMIRFAFAKVTVRWPWRRP